MRLRRQYLTQNDCYRTDRTIQVQGVMVHSTGANNPRAGDRPDPALDPPGLARRRRGQQHPHRL